MTVDRRGGWDRLTPARARSLLARLVAGAARADGRAGGRDRAARRQPILDIARRQPADPALRRGGHGRPADHGPDRVPDHLHGNEDHRADEPADRSGPGRAVRLAAVGRARAQGPHEGGLHPDRGGPAGLHLGTGRHLPVGGHDPARDPVRAGAVRPGPQPRAALLLRDRRPVGRRPADGRLGQLQQVLAARRAARRGPGHQLRDPADPVRGRADPAGRHAEPQHDRRAAGRLVPELVRLPAAARVPDLLHRCHRRGEPDAVRPDRGGLGDRGRLRDRVQRACASASSSSPST